MAAEEFIHWDIYTADAPDIPLFIDLVWIHQPHLIATSFTEGVAPTHPVLSFRWEFGSISRAHRTDPDSTLDYVAPVDLQYKYVLLQRSDESRFWVGYVRDAGRIEWSYEDDGTETSTLRVTGGTQFFTAYGLEYFLGRTQITGTSSREADKVRRPYSYNTGSGDGRDIDEAKRANREPPIDEMADPFDPLEFSFEDDAIEWDAAAIVKHLLGEYGPRDDLDAWSPLPYVLQEQAIPFLDWFKPTVKVEGRTLLQVLDEIISLRRGLVWWLEPTVIEDELVALIKVSSVVASNLSLPDSNILPAALDIVTIDDPSIYPLLSPPEIVRDGSRRYHRVRVRGARSTSTGSFIGPDVATEAFGSYTFDHGTNGTIEAAWSEDDEDDYYDGVSAIDGDYATYTDDEKQDRNDRYRQGDRFERVFRYFSVNFGGQIVPIIVQSTGSVIGWVTADERPVRLLNSTPMRVGYGYADATSPTVNGTLNKGEEFVRPFVLGYVPRGSLFMPTTLGEFVDDEPPSSTDGGWRRLQDRPSHKELGVSIHPDDPTPTEEDIHEREFRVSVSLSIMAGFPGFILRTSGGMAHSLAPHPPSSPTPDPLEPSRYGRSLQWPSTLVTAAVEWECYCEAVWPEVIPEATPVEELLISIGDRARFDWLCEGTVYDIDEHGHVLQCETQGALRDDRKLCETIARLAYEWYSDDHAKVQLTFRGGECPFSVGSLLTTIGTGAVQQTVNAPITQITHDLERGGFSVNCGYPEIDFGSLA